MNFIKPNLNSLPEQVDINTNDIKNLKSVLKASYKTEKELETTTITLPITDTNAPQGTTCGWLYDSVGHLYSINGGDDTNLLLEYYTSLQGIQGNEGVGIATIENVGYTDGEGYTITHCKVTLTNGTEEFFDVQAKQGTSGVEYVEEELDINNFSNYNALIEYFNNLNAKSIISVYFMFNLEGTISGSSTSYDISSSQTTIMETPLEQWQIGAQTFDRVAVNSSHLQFESFLKTSNNKSNVNFDIRRNPSGGYISMLNTTTTYNSSSIIINAQYTGNDTTDIKTRILQITIKYLK